MKFKTVGIIIILAVLLPLLIGCLNKKHRHLEQDMMIGVKVYNIDRELRPLFKEWSDMGINTVFASPSVVTDQFTSLARNHGIKTFLILPVFYDPTALKADPDIYAINERGEKAVDSWVEFVCPSREEFRKTKTEEIIRLVKDLDPDGISLDFIRYFCFWEKVYPDRDPDSISNTCFCPVCLGKFQADMNISVPVSPENVTEIARWITENHQAEWTNWKCSQITGMVKEINSSSIALSLDICLCC